MEKSGAALCLSLHRHLHLKQTKIPLLHTSLIESSIQTQYNNSKGSETSHATKVKH